MRKARTKAVEVTITVYVEIGDIEREAKLKFYCSPEEAMTRDHPGCDVDAEFMSGFFVDTGEDNVEDFLNPEDYVDEALEKADDDEEYDADAARDHRREEGF